MNFDFSNEKMKSYEPCFWKAFLFFYAWSFDRPTQRRQIGHAYPQTNKNIAKNDVSINKTRSNSSKIVN